MVNGARVTPRREIKRQRRGRAHSCWDHLIIAPLWPKYGVNLGTLLRTCDAVGACMAVPKLPWVPDALDKGNTLRRPACVHWTGRDPVAWLSRHRDPSLGVQSQGCRLDSAGDVLLGEALHDFVPVFLDRCAEPAESTIKQPHLGRRQLRLELRPFGGH
jgi:hypothetical protein